MKWQNPIVEDYKLFLVFSNMGHKMLQQLKMAMSTPLYSPYFKDVVLTDQNELFFTYLDHSFRTGLEVFFNHSRMPRSALVATYRLQKNTQEEEEIISYAYDLNYNINSIYTPENFAEYYLIEFHQNLKKCFSDNHHPFRIKINGK